MLRDIERRTSRVVNVGGVKIGGDNPIVVQSMTNTQTEDIESTLKQIHKLEDAGCEIIRVAVLNMDAAKCLSKINSQISIPLVADIHFDHRLALEAVKQGVDKVRLNPGNITKPEKIKEVVKACSDAGIPIRVGVNSGSLAHDILVKHEGATPDAMVESALIELNILESLNFKDALISLKSTDVRVMIESYRLMAKHVDYPFHLGVTESGMGPTGITKSALGIGALLEEGLGDTLRVSLTGDPTIEIKVGFDILGALGLRWKGIQFSSCPTCGRIKINLEKLVQEAEEKLKHIETPLKISLIGCVVNGLGEAAHSHFGLVGKDNAGTIYKDGKPLITVPEDQIVDTLVQLVEEYEEELKEAEATEVSA